MKHSKALIIVVVIVGFALLGLTLFRLYLSPKKQTNTANSQPQGQVVIEIKMGDNGFEPAKVTIKDGQAVRFINISQSEQHWPASNIHPTHDLYPEFDIKRGMAPGEQWVFTFRRKGIWPMHDHLYPYVKGAITVE